ncbi:hypothetical protein [uncultured Mucilaginibacter sp.]|uniref:hypothetical protein n=1 Tax=uncultured Mucilaginibacter sp. TaxID=797541 RepID=UPI0025F1D19E|nr:hypothetical protein [uncultured Mucilaginibacter sp.]
MEIKLIKGNFDALEAKELITSLVHIKIKYLENKIKLIEGHSEEDMKMREKRIIELQNELKKLNELIRFQQKQVEVNAHIEVSLV